jgi:putative aldouronate transport system substrate-binding protein
VNKKYVFLIALICISALAFAGGAKQDSAAAGTAKPLEITMFYYDNATLPFKSDWLTLTESQKRYNLKINWEVIPTGDYATKVSLVLNSGVNAPDAILYQNISGENASLAANGAILPVSDYSNWTPNWNDRVTEFGLKADVDRLKLKDGKLYLLPSLYDQPFYDAGLLLREDLLAKYGLPAPKTFDDLYNIAKAYKKDNPASYPITMLVGQRVHYRFTQPSWGISLYRDGAGGSRVLSWDYNKKTFFAGAISDQYREYMRFWNKMYAEGLLDPEMADPINNDVWNRKMATGVSIATYAYYDQIGGIAAATNIPGFKLQMYPPLVGPAGAHNQQKNRTGGGIIFPIGVSKRPDFERVIRAVDAMFFSKEAALLWCLGVEGQTYTMEANKIKYADSILSAPDGIYKSMQLRYGCGSASTQFVWVNAREMTKYDANYERINKEVAAMPDAIQAVPPTPKFDDAAAEKATSLMGTLYDAFVVWDNAFLTGTKSLDTDWNAFVTEMTSKGIKELLDLYNANL